MAKHFHPPIFPPGGTFFFHQEKVFLPPEGAGLKHWPSSVPRPGGLEWSDNLLLSWLIGARAEIFHKRTMMSCPPCIPLCLHFYFCSVSSAQLSCPSPPGDTVPHWELPGLSGCPSALFSSWGRGIPSGSWSCGHCDCSESAFSSGSPHSPQQLELSSEELHSLILPLLGSGGWIASGSPQSAPFIPGFWVAAYESLADGDITWLCFAYRQWFHLNKVRFRLCLLHCRVSSPTSPTMQQLCEEKKKYWTE